MDDGEEDEKIVAERMQAARQWVAKAEAAGAAGDRRGRLAAISEALNASRAAVAVIETWRLSMLEARREMTGEPSMTFSADIPPPTTRH